MKLMLVDNEGTVIDVFDVDSALEDTKRECPEENTSFHVELVADEAAEEAHRMVKWTLRKTLNIDTTTKPKRKRR